MTDQFGILEQELSHYTRAIGHPARVAVLIALSLRQGDVEGEIIEVPPLSQTTVIQHLRELKRAGLIQGRIFGTKSKYGIDHQNMERFFRLLQDFQIKVEK